VASHEFNSLWLGPERALVAKRSELQQFAISNTTKDGYPTIVVKGMLRLVKWDNLGAGLYRVYTVDK